MKTTNLVMILLVCIASVSCAPVVTVTSTQTFTPTIASFPTTTATFIPSPTLIPEPTRTPVPPPQISIGSIYYEWEIGDYPSPYIVWGARLRDFMNGDCQGFVCEGRDLRKYDDMVWKFLGRGDYGVNSFDFDINKNGQIDQDELFDTFNIRFRQDIGFDSITGTTQNKDILAYGFLTNGETTVPNGETYNLLLVTISEAKNKSYPQPICGIIDPNVFGDESFSVASDSGALIFSFLDREINENNITTPKSHSLISLTVSSAPKHLISPENVCP